MEVPGINDNYEWKALVNSLQPYLNRTPDEDTQGDSSPTQAEPAGPAEGETVVEEGSTQEAAGTTQEE